jgi:hypothetical protein
MRWTWTRGFAVWLAGCASSANTAGAPPPVPPIPIILQHVGEYDAPTGGSVARVALHVDGTFDATVDGADVHGTYRGPATPGSAAVVLSLDDGSTVDVAFRAAYAPALPPRALADVTRPGQRVQTLVAPWIADDEGMCDATHGTWHGDGPDPATGLRCRCDDERVYLPSRGGCVAPRDGEDPPRIPVSDVARSHAGIFEGTGRLSSITLATDGRYRATVDGVDEEGTWWNWESPGVDEGSVTIACTSASHAFSAAFEGDSTLTVHLGSDATESLRRRP